MLKETNIYPPLPMSISLDQAKAIQALPLRKQCDVLKIPRFQITRSAGQTSETTALKLLRGLGWHGSHCEGRTIECLLKAAAFNEISSRNELGYEDAKERYLMALMRTRDYKAENLKNEILDTSLETIKKRYAEIRDLCVSFGLIKNLPEADVAIEIFKGLGKHGACCLLEKYAKHKNEFAFGWPDLTVVRDGKIKLIEVKKDDKLHLSQIQTIPEVKSCLPPNANVEVLHLVRKTVPNFSLAHP